MGLIDSASYRLAVSEYENREPSDYEQVDNDYDNGDDLVEEAKLEEYYAKLEEGLEL